MGGLILTTDTKLLTNSTINADLCAAKIVEFMHFSGIIVGAAVFLSIGICHPAVIKMEYYLGKKSWWLWLIVGLMVSCASLFVSNPTVSTILGGFAFSCFWGILEMHQQEQRVVKGWFPENPKRHDYYEALRKSSPKGHTK